jgi:hypothetical protein
MFILCEIKLLFKIIFNLPGRSVILHNRFTRVKLILFTESTNCNKMRSIQKIFSHCMPKAGISVLTSFVLISLMGSAVQAQWNNNTLVNLQISSLPTADMQTAPTSDGKTWVAFYHQNGGNYDMRAQLIDANGYKLLGTDGVLVSNQTSGSATYVFNICVDPSNNLIIANQDMRSGPMNAVVYKISEAGTQLWSSTGIVLGGGLSPYPAVLSNGEVAVVWNETVSNTLNLQKITTSGTLAWSVGIPILVGSTGTTRGQVIGQTSGKFTVVFQKKGVGISTTLYSQAFDNSGNSLYTPVQLSSLTTSGARYYSIVGEVDTIYCGYYASSGSRFNSYLQRINPDGTIPWGINGSNFNTSTGGSDSYQMTTSINMTPGSNYVWSVCTFSNPSQTTYGVYVQKFLKTSGARQFTDAGKVVYGISSNTDQLAGNLALTSDTPMFMNYDVTGKIYATRLDASGNFIWPGNRVEISSTTSLSKLRYGFSPDGPNRCAGTWVETRSSVALGYAQGISIGGLIGVKVATQGNVPAVITTSGGTLQMVDTVFPASASQAVTWSIVLGTGSASISTGGLVTAISNGTVYAKAVAVQDITVKDSMMITISGQAPQVPTVVTLAATGIGPNVATLNGTVNANSSTTTVSFNWGLTTAYGNTIGATPGTVTGNTPTPVLANLTGLLPLTTYHFRVTATNSVGTSNGNDMTFTTTSGLPTVTTEPASNIGTNNAQLNGTVNANTFSTTVSFDWGQTTSYGNTIAGIPSPVTGNTPTAVLANISGLTNGTTYHFRCNGTNTYGTTNGNDMSFVAGCQLPSAAGTITGPASVCEYTPNVAYSVGAIANATSYTWTVPAGSTIISGQGTQNITVNFGNTSGNVTVTGVNSCGSGTPSSITVTVNPYPAQAGNINGLSSLCAGASGVSYSVPPISNAVTYIWVLPYGATISTGAGTDSITVDFALNASSGNVTVYGNNLCGNGNASSLAVTVNPVPLAPVISANYSWLTSNAPAGNQWYLEGIAIPGATNQTYLATQNGHYWDVVTLNGCSSDTSNHIYLVNVGINDKTHALGVDLYPNPNDGRFTLQISTTQQTNFDLEVYNSLGVNIHSIQDLTFPANQNQNIDLRTEPNGVYILILRNRDNLISRKFEIRK